MQIHLATMVKDEADRFWRSALQAWAEFSDSILVLDDGSTDATMEIAQQEIPELLVPVEPVEDTDHAWGNETPYREMLFNFAIDVAEPGDVIFFEDADMTPLRDPTEIFTKSTADAFCFYLYDLWATDEMHVTRQYETGEFAFRDEKPYWQAHRNPRTWAIRVSEDDKDGTFTFDHDRGIHSGHIPSDWWGRGRDRCIVPKTHAIAHYGYLHPADREEKEEKYRAVEDQLTDFERAHAETITDPHPKIRPLAHDMDYVLEKA